jgi:molybdenum cofactor biosynthesis enzyme MoaA
MIFPRNCLYSDSEFNLRAVMRAGGSDDDMVALFRKAFAEKARDGFESKKLSVAASKKVMVGDIRRISMTQIGG